MPKVFIFYNDLTLSVAQVTENGRKYRLKCRKYHFGPHFGGFTDKCFPKLDISTAKYNKNNYFDILCILLSFIIYLNIVLVFACALC